MLIPRCRASSRIPTPVWSIETLDRARALRKMSKVLGPDRN